METTKKAFKGDKLKSSYWWTMNLTQANSVRQMTGYSKMQDQSEAQDKDYLLKSKICMLYKYGWLRKEKILNIQIHQKAENLINHKWDACIIILYPDRYEIPQQNFALVFKKYGDFLNNFYDDIKHDRDVYLRLKSRKPPINKDDFLNTDKFEFKGSQHLYSYCAKLLDYGHPIGSVESFMAKVKDKHNLI